MKIGSFGKIKSFLIALILLLTTTTALAEDNIISSVVISKSKERANGYELSIDSTRPVQYKATMDEDRGIYFDLKNSVVSPEMGTIYDDASNIDNVVVKQLDKNKVRIYVSGKDAQNTELVFVNSLFETKQDQSKKIVINRPINEYKPTNYNDDLENQEDIQDWNDNSFNIGHLISALFAGLRDGVGGIVLMMLALFAVFAAIIKNLTSKISQDREPLIGLNNSKYLKENYEIAAKKVQNNIMPQQELSELNRRNQTLKTAQEELGRAHAKYQQYIQNKYQGSYKPKSVNVDAIKKSIGLNQYQKSTKNPYVDQEVIRINRENRQTEGNFAIPPRPKAPKTEFSSPYIHRSNNKINVPAAKKENPKGNMKFLESVTKIYEQSGRGDLASDLKNSITKAKQSI